MTDPKNQSLIKSPGNSLARVQKKLTITNKLLAKSSDKFVEFCLRHPDFFITMISYRYPLSFKLIEKYKDKWDWNWILSWNEALPWSEELIEKYEDKWDWDWLSRNKGLPWSEELIEKYEDKWDWEMLSSNEGLPWSEELIEKYKDKWDWKGGFWSLSRNKGLPWSEELIEKYEDKWAWKVFHWNEVIWNKIFKPYVTDEIIERVMDRSRQKELSRMEK